MRLIGGKVFDPELGFVEKELCFVASYIASQLKVCISLLPLWLGVVM